MKTNISNKLIKSASKLCEGNFKNFHVAVAGDFMLDCYINGEVKRISPEAPVPVVKILGEHYVLGGAGNAVANLAGLGVNVLPIGRIGEDANADLFLNQELMQNLDKSLIIKKDITSVKTRILGSGYQQMMRLDRENLIVTDEEQAAEITAKLEAYKEKIDVMIISDYEKGFCSEVLCSKLAAFCRSKDIPLLIDPKKSDWSCYQGAALITPNLKELGEAFGCELKNEDDAIIAAARKLLNKYDIKYILATRSEKGASLISKTDLFHIPASPIEVFDVSGAGDTTIATMAAFMAAGIDIRESAVLANATSQIVVGKVGTYPIKASDLLNLFNSQTYSYISSKIADKKTAEKIVTSWKADGEKVIFTNGCFDIIHSGHIDSLNKAKELGSRLIIGLNSDASVKRLKGEARPVNRELDRAKILAALEAVDLVVIFDEDTPTELLSLLRPNVIAKGGDYTAEQVAGREYADEVVIIPLTDGYSTTGIIERMK